MLASVASNDADAVAGAKRAAPFEATPAPPKKVMVQVSGTRLVPAWLWCRGTDTSLRALCRRHQHSRQQRTLPCQHRCCTGKTPRCQAPRRTCSASWTTQLIRCGRCVLRSAGLPQAPSSAGSRLLLTLLPPLPSAQLKLAQARLQQREESMSVLDRHWAHLEARLGAVAAQLPASAGDAADAAAARLPRETLLQKLSAATAEAAALDASLQRRCEVTAALAETVARAVASAAASSGDDAARALVKLHGEAGALSAELGLMRDRAGVATRERDDAAARLERSVSELEKKTRDLEKARTEIQVLKSDGAGSSSGGAGGSGSGAATAAAIDAAGGSLSCNGGTGGEGGSTSVLSAELEKLRVDAEAAREERAAFEKAAEGARTELQAVQVSPRLLGLALLLIV